ncbi:MAG: heme-binding domain-containing protein [Opitutaceae bacterium]|nr:heme-binding domain-containing protein [Opitutaceae bacterium]
MRKSTKRALRRYLIGAAVVLIAIQFARLPKNVSATPWDGRLPERFEAPPEVQSLLAASCYDCHSDNTRYPWYAEVQPVGWWLNMHVRAGRKHLDFSKFDEITVGRAARRLEGIAESVYVGRMPLPAYARLHGEARLTEEQRRQIADWANTISEKFMAEAERTGATPPPGH